ncbi:MAG TPA: hypothetical protein VFJ30_12370 [Phycisphaerae bacterium]|nr:hypothetical protein [Phycisphaerae bacterium]
MTELPPSATQPSSPPTAPPPIAPRPSRWHVPIGVISVALAGLGLIVSILSAAGVSMNSQQSQMMETLPAWYGSYARLTGLIGAGITLLLLAGGILLLKRRTAGRGLLLTYAVLNVLSNLIGAVVSYRAASEMTGEGMQADAMRIGMRVGGVMGVLVGSAFPVFLVVWFCRWKVRTDMQNWVPESRPL